MMSCIRTFVLCYYILRNDTHNDHLTILFGIAVLNIIKNEQVQAIIGTLTSSLVELISEIDNSTKDIPIVSLAPFAMSTPWSPQFPPFIHMGNNISLATRCIAAVVGHFRWRKVTAIYEQNNRLSTECCFLTFLSDSLRVVDSMIDHHSSFSRTAIEEELNKLKGKSNRVFIVTESSI